MRKSLQRDVYIDRDHPLNVSATINGPSVTIAISVTYCAENITRTHP